MPTRQPGERRDPGFALFRDSSKDGDVETWVLAFAGMTNSKEGVRAAAASFQRKLESILILIQTTRRTASSRRIPAFAAMTT